MLSIYILILGFISGVTMETCPEPEDIFPCQCTKIKTIIFVECNRFSKTAMPLKLLGNVLKGLIGKNNVQLHLFNIQDTLPSNMFSGIGITNLVFRSCRMDTLTNDNQPGLLGLENYLQVLEIENTDLSSMKLHLGHLNKLREIMFYANNGLELEDDWMSDAPPSLKNLHFTHNNIGKIGNHAFSRLNSLRLLQLDDIRLGPMKRTMFPDGLEMLQLNNNTLTDLPVDLFSNMPSIVTVILNRNRITTLEERTWAIIWEQLKSLEIRGNNIICDDRLSWITESEKRPYILGECSAPKKWEKASLEDFFKSKSR